MKLKRTYQFFGAMFLLLAFAVCAHADDTYVYTFTSKTWAVTATKNGTAFTSAAWNYSKAGYTYSSDYGVRCRAREATQFTICAPINLENIKSVKIYYQQATGCTGVFNLSVATTNTYTYNTSGQFATQSVSNTNSTTKNFSKTGLSVSGYLQIQIKPSTSYNTRATAISKVEIVVGASATPATVSFNAHGKATNPSALTEANAGGGVILPDLEVSPVCGRWQFAGWAKSSVSTATTTAPTLYAAGSKFIPEANTTLHAVYKKDGSLASTSTKYDFNKGSATLATDNGTWTGTAPSTYYSSAYSAAYGVGWATNPATIYSPTSLNNISKIVVLPYTSNYWTSEMDGTYEVYVGGTLVGTVEESNSTTAPQTINVSPAQSGTVSIKIVRGSLGASSTLYLTYVEVYYTDYVGYTYHSTPTCPEDITENVLWKADGFTLEGRSSGSITLPRSKMVSGVHNATKDVLDFTTSLPQGEIIELTVDGAAKCAVVPAIVSSATTSLSTTAKDNIVILPGAKLTVTSGTINAKKLFIYRTADHSGELDFRGGTFNLSGKAHLVLTIDPKRFYFFGTPNSCALSSARYLNGDDANYDTSDATKDWWIVQNYDGARRASAGTDEKNWQGIQSSSTTLKAAEGHAIGIDIVGKANAQRSYVFPFTADFTKENTAKTISLTAHPTSLTQLDEGWNMVCNPYLHAMSGRGASLPTNRILYFVRPYKGTDQRFQQYMASEVRDIEPFEVFFVQVCGSSNSILTLGTGGARPSAPRRAPQQDMLPEFYLRLNLLAPDGDSDYTTVIVGQDFSADGLNAGEDMEKFGSGNFVQIYALEQGYRLAFDAIGFDDAAQGTQLGFKAVVAGEHKVSFDELNDNKGLLEHVWLLDANGNAEHDLLAGDYAFNSAAGTFNDRFTLRPEFKELPHTPTALEDAGKDMTVTAADGVITVSGINGAQTVRLLSADGKVISTATASGQWQSALLPKGMYMLQCTGKTVKVVL